MTKNTSELFTVFPHPPAMNSSRGHSKPSEECVVMTLRLIPRRHAVVWQTDLSWREKCVKTGFGNRQKQIPRGIWQISRAVGKVERLKMKVTWKCADSPPVIRHIPIDEDSNVNIFRKKQCDGPIWDIKQQLRCLAGFLQLPPEAKMPVSSRTAGIPPTTTVLQSHLCAQIRLTGLTSWRAVKATSFQPSEGETPSTHTSTEHVWLRDTCTRKGWRLTGLLEMLRVGSIRVAGSCCGKLTWLDGQSWKCLQAASQHVWRWSAQTIKSSSRGEQTHADGPVKCNRYPMEEGRGKACSRPQIQHNFTWNNTNLYWFTKLGGKNHYLKHSKLFSVQLKLLLQWHFKTQWACRSGDSHLRIEQISA